ncbi:MAG: hypothetical protein R6U31_01470 [bacterium]
MKNVKLISSIILCFMAFPLLAGTASDGNINLLEWAGPEGTEPGTRKQWAAEHPVHSHRMPSFKSTYYGSKDSLIHRALIIVEDSLYDSIQMELSYFINDLNSENYTIDLYTVMYIAPESLRAFLYDCYRNQKIEGALLIGDIPTAWFQVENDFNTYGYAEWPFDYFYMELNGIWLDDYDYSSGTPIAGSDSIYDGHSGDEMPEIYIARIFPNGMGQSADLINNYFMKNHNYRDNSNLPQKALVYVDDDWESLADIWGSDVALAYSDTLIISHPESTIVDDYKKKVMEPREWVALFAHSWPGGHAFYYNNGSNVNYFWATGYTSMIPPAAFYNFFCCSFARFTESGYGAGRAIFTDSISIASIGSAKTGSMLDFDYFYQPLSENKSLGVSYKEWFEYIAEGGIDFNELCWHGGMVLLGDPFITVKRQNLTGLQSDRYSDKSYAGSLVSISDMEDMLNRKSIDLYDCQGRQIVNSMITPGIYFIRIKNSTVIRKYIVPGL